MSAGPSTRTAAVSETALYIAVSVTLAAGATPSS